MEHDDHYRLLGIYLLVVFTLAAWLLCGCTTSRQLTEERQIRDSINIKDSVRITDSIRTVTNIKDSLRIKDSTVVVMDEQGNVKSKEVWHEKEHFRKEQDSTLIYKAMLKEALYAREQALKEQKTEKVVVEKPIKLADKARYAFIGFVIGIVVTVSLILEYVKWRNRRKREI